MTPSLATLGEPAPEGAPAASLAIAPWLPVLARLGVPQTLAEGLARRAAANGTDLLAELAATGLISEPHHYRVLAETLGLAFAEEIDPNALVVSEEQCLMLLGQPEHGQMVKLREPDIASVVIAPRRLDLPAMREYLEWLPTLRDRLRLTAPSVLRQAMTERARAHLSRRARMHLHETQPLMSARNVGNAWQGAYFSFLALFVPGALVIAPLTTLFAIHAVASIFFFACVALRLRAAPSASPPRAGPVARPPAADAPVYSVLVALYREAEVVPELLTSLARLQWPRSKLEIKLVCEADDAATLAALDALTLRPFVEVVRVPPIGPRTKPKALNYALPLASGEYVALYDAEDRPHPMQLVEAWSRFRECADDVACLQAPLTVENGADGWIATSFAFEYAALFRGLLPHLSRRRTMLPLGGTSNHFRRDRLDEVGGWDPYNVTEDADLAVRLARFGYRSETIGCPTGEDCVTNWRAWLPQRTRWFKGWATTWLVHMRNPARSAREMGWRSFLAMQVLFAGAIVSTLVHPLFLGTMVWLLGWLAVGGAFATYHSVLLLIDSANIALGYMAFWLLGWRTLDRVERKRFWRVVLFTPIYWTMMSFAAWRAIWQLTRTPHVWEKTEHKPRRASAGS